MTDDRARREALAGFLRSRRQQVRPADVGLAVSGRRRTPGLRREEVAALSQVSITWYTWLEQARDIRPGRAVLDGIADALQLTATERRHLHELSEPAARPAADPTDAAEQAAPAIDPVLAQAIRELSPNPAYLLDPTWQLVDWNDAESALIGDPAARAPRDRNVVWQLFTDPAMRRLVVDWESEAEQLLGQYRAAAARHAGEERFESLTARLLEVSAEFRALWSRHDIATFRPTEKRFDHPRVGALRLRYCKLAPVHDDEVTMVAYFAADEATRAGLRRLVRPVSGSA